MQVVPARREKELEKEVTRKRVALYTFGIFRAPATDPSNQGFHDRNDVNFLAAESSEGFIARSGYADEPGPESWGKQVYPRFYEEKGDGWSPSSLSLWRDLISPMAFSYSGIHSEALKHGRSWFLKPEWPPYVLWWEEETHTPTWAEAIQRHEYLHDHGPTAWAFDFKQPYDVTGQRTVLNREDLKQYVESNQARQALLSEADSGAENDD